MYNNVKLNRFYNEVESIPYQEGTEILNIDKRVGVLTGGSNHCDMAVVAVIESDLDYKDFYTFIQSHSIQYPFSGSGSASVIKKENGLYYLLGESSTNEILKYSFTYDDYSNVPGLFFLEYYEREIINRIEESDSNKNLYILSLLDTTFTGFSMYDLRAH